VRLCPTCAAELVDPGWRCRECGTEPPTIDGFRAFAPTSASGGVGFQESYFAELAALEDANFWFRARNELILWAVASYFPDARRVLEVGCGTGYVLQGIRQQMPAAHLTGSELFITGLGFAAARVPSADFYQMDATAIPFRDHFDLVGAFDVLEHILDDETVIDQMARAIVPGGGILLTVPQHPALWSPQDVLAEHVRRYTAAGVRSKLTAAGLEIVRMTSFTTLLLPRDRGRSTGPVGRIHGQAPRKHRPHGGPVFP
jgi:SAM-dependent methyltransferase